MRFSTLLAVLAAALVLPRLADAQPSLSHLSPGAVAPGQTTEVTLHGAKLDDPLQIWTSFPATIELVPAAADAKDLTSRVCKVTLAADVPVGVGGMAVASPAGATDLVFVHVDDLPSVGDQGNNHAAAQAQAVTPPVGIDGVSNGNQFDYFKFPAKAGQRLAIEVVAARAGADFDPVLRLLDAAGNELAYADDDAGLGADCRMAYTFPTDGEYVLELFDNQYRASGRYRLRIGDFPLVSTPYPLGARWGSTARFEFTGPAADDAGPLLLRIPDGDAAGRLMVSAKRTDGSSSAAAILAASPLPEAMETEPNNEPAAATVVTLPCSVNGVLREADDRDHFQFAGVKGQAVRCSALSRSLGSPTLVQLTLLDANGATLASTNAGAADEVELAHTLPADGMYVLKVEELLRRGGPEFAYRVELQARPGFEVTLKNDKNVPTRFATPAGDGAFPLDLQCERRGYDGPIQVSLATGTDKYRLLGGPIPAGAKAHRVVVAATPAAQPGDVLGLRLEASADVDGAPYTTTLHTAALNRTQRPQFAILPAWLDGLLLSAVGNATDPLFDVETPAAVELPADASQPAKFSATLQRKHKDFKGGLNVFLTGLPPEINYEVKAEGDRYDVTISGPLDRLRESGPLQLLAFGELNARGQLVEKAINVTAPAAAAP